MVRKVLIGSLFILCLIVLSCENKFGMVCIVIDMLLYSLMVYISNAVTSLRSFMLFGIVGSLFILCNFTSIIMYKSSITQYVIIVLMLIIIWTILSFLANNKVAKLANIIFASFNAIIIYINDKLFNLIPDKIIDIYIMNKFDNGSKYLMVLDNYGISVKSIINLLIALIFVPILITNVIATLACEIKKYWINKYNEGKDISLELIEKENNKNA
ncbi:MAG: hypothetical protein ACI4S3_09505 [Candidatus Gastranaerophilaceae bacterium]